MVWYNLRIGTYNLKYTPLSPSKKENVYCDNEGKVLEFVKGKFESGYFMKDGEKYEDEIFYLVNDKPRTKLGKTKEVNNYKEVDKSEVDDLIVEKQYIVEDKKLLQDLNDSGKTLKFAMSLGGGGKFGSVKVYYAYVYPSELYEGILFMSLGTTKKSEIIQEVLGEIEQKEKLEQLQATISGIKKTEVEDLLEI